LRTSVISYAIRPEPARVDDRHIRGPAAILVGDAGEQVVADQFVPLPKRPGVAIPVTIVPHMTHTEMIGSPVALREVARAIVRQE
jgi:hypothetical protein